MSIRFIPDELLNLILLELNLIDIYNLYDVLEDQIERVVNNPSFYIPYFTSVYQDHNFPIYEQPKSFINGLTQFYEYSDHSDHTKLILKTFNQDQMFSLTITSKNLANILQVVNKQFQVNTEVHTFRTIYGRLNTLQVSFYKNTDFNGYSLVLALEYGEMIDIGISFSDLSYIIWAALYYDNDNIDIKFRSN